MIARSELPLPEQERAQKAFADSAQQTAAVRKERSDKGIPKGPKPVPRSVTGDLFDFESIEGRTFVLGTVRYWVSIHASPQVEAVIQWLFKELDRRPKL